MKAGFLCFCLLDVVCETKTDGQVYTVLIITHQQVQTFVLSHMSWYSLVISPHMDEKNCMS